MPIIDFRRRVPTIVCLSSLLCACKFDSGDRYGPSTTKAPICSVGLTRCDPKGVVRCEQGGIDNEWRVIDDCISRGLVCASELTRCTSCIPKSRACQDGNVIQCDSEGNAAGIIETCEVIKGDACRDGYCKNLCEIAADTRSNVGCEYWAADLDNAMIDATLNAAAQQYAIVVSNPQPDVPARVTIEQDDSLPGQQNAPSVVASAEVQPLDLRVFKLGPREVDGSPPGQFNTGTGTALTRHAYRIRSHVPVVAYQFNPLDNVGVFSNDASLLKPVEALTYLTNSIDLNYVVVGWPQTIAVTDDPNTNWGNTDLRAFVAIIGTRPDTHVRFSTTTRVIAGGPVLETKPGGVIQATLQPFDVLNLETGGFNADFTGSTIESDRPIVVFSGGEASDAPKFDKLSDRFCCADHLEDQLDPTRTAGKTFVAAHGPSRTRAVALAGADIEAIEEPEYFRVVAVSDGTTLVTTSLPPPNDTFSLEGRGAWRDITTRFGSKQSPDFHMVADKPVLLGNVQPSQDAAGVQRGLPGGDPSLIIIPPIEQYRSSYVFLTPDKYMFDFISIAAPKGAVIRLDNNPLESFGCEQSEVNAALASSSAQTFVVYRCQLSFPVIVKDPSGPNGIRVLPGIQNDGVHRLQSDTDMMVIAYGFDNYVSYGYAAGTKLQDISAPR